MPDKSTNFILCFAQSYCVIHATRAWLLYFKKYFSNSTIKIVEQTSQHIHKKQIGHLYFHTKEKKHDVSEIRIQFTDIATAHIYIGAQDHFMYPILSHTIAKIFTRILSLDGAIILHASAIVYKNKAYVFVGRSGAGKTTLARLCANRYRTSVVSDNQAFIRKQQDKYYLFPFPFDQYHNHQFIKESVPINALFFLEQAKRNQKILLSLENILKKAVTHIQIHTYGSDDTEFNSDIEKRLFIFLISIKIYQFSFSLTGNLWKVLHE